MKMKTIFMIATGLFVLCVTGCRDDEVVRRNTENLKRVSEGMHWSDAYAIMGEYQYCDTTEHRKWLKEHGREEEYIFMYQASSWASGDFEIRVTVKDSLIVGVYRGE